MSLGKGKPSKDLKPKSKQFKFVKYGQQMEGNKCTPLNKQGGSYNGAGE